MNRTISDDGRGFIQRREALRLKPYLDSIGKRTIGWGHLMQPSDPNVPITMQEAQALFDGDVLHVEERLNDVLAVDPGQWAFDALGSMLFNAGVGAIHEGTKLLMYLNAAPDESGRDYAPDAIIEFLDFCHAGGALVSGLLLRRAMEARIWARGEYPQ